MATPLTRKLVIVGDGMVGKTALLWSYVHREFNQDYIPTVFETTAKSVKIRSAQRSVTIGIWDTGGQEEFDQIRQFAYPGSRIILLCYAVDCNTSLDNIYETWITEINDNCPNVPIILVGCKSDKRIPEDPNQATNIIKISDIIEVADRINAYAHIECSAKTGSNVVTLFEWAAEIINRIDEKEEEQLLNNNRENSFNMLKRLSIRKNAKDSTRSNKIINSDLPRKAKRGPFFFCGSHSSAQD